MGKADATRIGIVDEVVGQVTPDAVTWLLGRELREGDDLVPLAMQSSVAQVGSKSR